MGLPCRVGRNLAPRLATCNLSKLAPGLCTHLSNAFSSPSRLRFELLWREIGRRAMADQDDGYGFPDDAGADEDQSIISVRLTRTPGERTLD